MHNYKILRLLLFIVVSAVVCAEEQWPNSVEAAAAGTEGMETTDSQPSDTSARLNDVSQSGQAESVTGETRAVDGGQTGPTPRLDQAAESGSAGPGTGEMETPSFQSPGGAPEQPTLRQVLESMKPPSLTDDESAAGSVWLHSKAGPDMAELADGEQEQLTSSGLEQPDDTGQQQQNVTAPDGAEENGAANSTAKLCSCLPLDQEVHELTVKLVNGSGLSEALVADASVRSRSQPAVCLIVLFYGRTCPFSAAAAPHVNALPRAFPDLRVLAVDALENSSLNTRFGIIAVPTVLLFHNGRPQARFNQSEPTLSRLAEFVAAHTHLTAAGPLEVTPSDQAGPLPCTAEQRLDWYLVAAWLFIAVCAAYAGARLRLWRRAADWLRNWWIEAEQHLHED